MMARSYPLGKEASQGQLGEDHPLSKDFPQDTPEAPFCDRGTVGSQKPEGSWKA